MSEKSVCQAWASVMVYDEQSKKWKPAGNSQGVARVCIYKREGGPASYRVVGRKESDHEVVINCSITKNLKYNKATATFHQWRDARTVYGLNFSTKEDAASFSDGMDAAIKQLMSGADNEPSQAEIEAKRREQQRIEEERAEYERQEAEKLQQQRERERQARERAASASAAPPAPGGIPAPPPPPPPPPAPPAAPPAPPVPSASSCSSGGGGGGGGGGLDMAAALSAVRLKKSEPVEEKPAGGGGGGGGDFMGELQKRMAAKRANKSDVIDPAASKPIAANSAPIAQTMKPSENKRPPWQKNNISGSATLGQPITNKGSPIAKKYGAGANRNTATNGNSSADLDSIKQEIINEVRTEMKKMKEEILTAIRQELSNR